MSEQDLVLNLKAAGFEKEMIENYLTCWSEGRVDRQLELLSKKESACWNRYTGKKKRLIAWTIWSTKSVKTGISYDFTDFTFLLL